MIYEKKLYSIRCITQYNMYIGHQIYDGVREGQAAHARIESIGTTEMRVRVYTY